VAGAADLARLDALAVVAKAVEEDTHRLQTVTENHHRALNVQAAEIVAQARAASESALVEVRTLGRRLGVDTRS
jgi:hypothetical protein